MKKEVIIYVLLIIGLFLWLLPSVGQAATVNCNLGQSLQGAINSAAAGSTIKVKGTCNENVLIDETRINITLDGGGTATIHGTSVTQDTVDVRGRGIVIKRLHITGGNNGINVHRGGTATIDSNTIELTNNNGVLVGAAGFATFINNMIQNNTQHGIGIQDNATAHIGFDSYSDTVAQPNTIQNNGNQGINIQRSSSASVVGNIIKNNTYNGIKVRRDSHADISANVINGNDYNGIRVEDNSGVNLGNTTGSTIFDLSNSTTVNNGIKGISCNIGGYADGLLGTLNGVNGATVFSKGCVNNLI